MIPEKKTLRQITSLQSEKIKATYPKAYKRFVEWFYLEDKFEGEEVKSITEEERVLMCNWVLTLSPRTLFDFFDDVNLKLGIYYESNIEKYKYYIKANSLESIAEEGFPSRNSTEEKMFEDAFKELENQLNNGTDNI